MSQYLKVLNICRDRVYSDSNALLRQALATERSAYSHCIPTYNIITLSSTIMNFENHPAMIIYRDLRSKYDLVNTTIAAGDSDVQMFYKDAVIIVTGGSGFIGKQMIEKLFRSCKIKNLYLILRPRHNVTIKERLKIILEDKLFDYLHDNQPDFVSKIVPVKGDITQPRLGIDLSTLNTLIKEVNVIFHVAATVNFMESLKLATLTNVRATVEMLIFAHACKNLRSFVHVSTAFVHATRHRVGVSTTEQFYDTPLSPDVLIKLCEQLDQETIDTITPELLKGWPNTYSFTKALAEETIKTMAAGLPICIVRPSIVMGGFKEPIGWCDKAGAMNGPVGFILGACIGALHVMLADKTLKVDLVPVDFVNNATLVAAYYTAKRCREGQNDIKIYTINSRRNPTTIEYLRDFCEVKARGFTTPKIIWYGYLILTRSSLLFTILSWLLHYLPGYLADGALYLAGKRPRAINLLTRAYKQNQLFSYFNLNEFIFEDKNTLTMYKSLSAKDQIIYEFDVDVIDYEKYFYALTIGVRTYLLKDNLKDTEYALKKQKVLKMVNIVYLTIYAYVLWKIISFIFRFIYYLTIKV